MILKKQQQQKKHFIGHSERLIGHQLIILEKKGLNHTLILTFWVGTLVQNYQIIHERESSCLWKNHS